MPSSKPEQGQSLADLYPEIAKEWHPDKNVDLKPTDVRTGSNKRVWWKCSVCGNEWQTSIAHRACNNRGCPKCAVINAHKKQAQPKQGESLADLYPDLSKEWHPTLNGDLKPTDVRPFSIRNVWWKCNRGHEWQAVIGSRTQGRCCPYCKATGTSYGEQFVYWSLKQIYPDTINRFKTSNKVEYDIYIPSIRLAIEYSGLRWHEGREERDKYKKELAINSGVKIVSIIENYNCQASIVSNEYFEYNPSKNQENNLVYITSLILDKYNHSISEIDFNLVKQQAIEYSKGKIEHEKSIEYTHPEITKEWHPTLNGDFKPTDATYGSTKKVWWKCSVCGHEWQADIKHRTYGRGCPECARNRRKKQ